VFAVHLPLPPRIHLERQYEEFRESYEKILFEIQRRVRLSLTSHDLNATIKYRVKSFNSWYQKLLRLVREEPDAESVEIADVLALRVVTPFLDDVAVSLATLRSDFEVHDLDRKGAQFSVREFGYESVHCLLRVPKDVCESFHVPGPFDCEVQVRTSLQDAWAEVEHEIIYKNEYSPLDASLQRKLAALNASLSLSDITFQEIRDYQRDLRSELSARRVEFLRRVEVETSPQAMQEPAPRRSTGATPEPDEPAGNLDTELLAALRAHNAGDLQHAEQIYTRIIESDPGPKVASVVYMHRGVARFARGSHRDALHDFSAAIDLDSGSGRAHFYRGTVYRVLGNTEAALEDFTACLDADPYSTDCLYQRSATHLDAGDLEHALVDCEAGLAIEPDSSPLMQLNNTINERRKYGADHD